MVAKEFLGLYTKHQLASLVGVEDGADRLNYAYTVVLLVICDALVASGTYLATAPIKCHVPTTPSGEKFQAYANNYCWIEGTMPLRANETVPQNPEAWDHLSETRKINYYQWVPFVLGLQCMLFYLPRFLWQSISFNRLGLDISSLIVKANEAMSCNSNKARHACITHVANSLDMLLFAHRDYRHGFFADIRRQLARLCGICFVSKRMGTWIVFSYFCIKCLYLVNCFFQLWLMRQFLGTEYTMWEYGLRFASNLVNEVHSSESLIFPRVTFCAVNLRHLGTKDNIYTAMCALPVNMLNEKVYIFLYFWVYFVTISTAISIPIWFLRLTNRRYRVHTIMKYFKMKPPKHRLPSSTPLPTEPDDDFDGDSPFDMILAHKLPKQDDVTDFVNEFLRLDGVFIVHVLRLNAGDMVTGDIIRLLWYNWLGRYAGRRNFNRDYAGTDWIGNREGDFPMNKLMGSLEKNGKIPPTPMKPHEGPTKVTPPISEHNYV